MLVNISKAKRVLDRKGPKGLATAIKRQVLRRIRPPIHSAFRNVYLNTRNYPNVSAGDKLYPIEDPEPNWRSHDERWSRVVDRFEHREALQNGRALTVSEKTQDLSERVSWEGSDSLSIDVDADKSDRWVWLALDPEQHSWKDFRWEFDVTRHSEFRELQFGFRYNGFYNRHRFQHEYGKWRYEKVSNGAFYKHYDTQPFEMELGREYHVAIQAVDNRYTLEVDGQLIIEEVDFANSFPRGSCAIILWDDDEDVPIQADIRNMTVTEFTK